MNTKERAFQVVSQISKQKDKQELSSQKVELAMIDDINSLYEKGFSLYDVQSELLKAQDRVKKSKDLFDQSAKKADEAIQKSKEIGASDFVKLFQNKLDEAKSASRTADSLISAIDKAITIL